MIVHYHLLLLEISSHLSNLLLSRHQLITLPLLTHLQDPHLAHVVVIIEVVFSSVDTLRLSLNETHSSTYDLVVPVLVDLSCTLSDLLDTLDKTVMVAIGIESDDSHPTVDLHHLLPVWHLTWPIELHCLKLERIPIPSF